MTDSNSAEETAAKEKRKFVFKDRNFSYYINISKKKTWKSLKQIISQEHNLPWPKDTIHYSSVVTPPSFKPAKKYSDISGLPAKYIDPQTKLYYSTIDEFTIVRTLPSDIITGYLTLRGEHNPIG
ncbi:hypothetical protein PGB90_003390 [Kerria lacca]